MLEDIFSSASALPLTIPNFCVHARAFRPADCIQPTTLYIFSHPRTALHVHTTTHTDLYPHIRIIYSLTTYHINLIH